MLNNEKIKLMTKLAVYEQKEGREDIKLSRYYKTDFIRFQILKSIVCVTISYVIVLGVLAFYNMEYLITNAVSMNYGALITYIVAIYVLLLAIYILGSILLYSIRFDQSRKRLGRYFHNLKTLRQMYEKEEKPD